MFKCMCRFPVGKIGFYLTGNEMMSIIQRHIVMNKEVLQEMLFERKWKARAWEACFAMICMVLFLGSCVHPNKQPTQNDRQVCDTEEVNTAQKEQSIPVTEEPVVQDMEAILEGMRPAVVQLYCEMPDGGHIAASGFLMEISEDNIYICTNRHVIEGYEKWQVYFFDGTMALGDNIGVSDTYDVGVVSVPLTEVQEQVRSELKTVHIDMDAWENIGNGQPDIGFLRVGQDGEVLYTMTGKVLRIQTDFPWGNSKKETELSMEQTQGDSGSALFDRDGNLISMVHGNSNDVGGERNWGIPLDGLILSYQEITGRTLELYE